MSEKISLNNSEEIKKWALQNGFDTVNLDLDAPRFFQSRMPQGSGSMALFSIEHIFLNKDNKPVVSLKRVIRSISAEDALYQYMKESSERRSGKDEFSVGFKTYLKPGYSDSEAIKVARLIDA
jgi:hypothetical protein